MLAGFALLAAMLTVSITGVAQSAGTGAIEGRITDPSGAVIPQVTVTLKNAGTGAIRTMESDSVGHYRAALLQPGTYEITATLAGFGALKRSGVNVEVGSVATINLELQVAGVDTAVIVVEEAPLANPEKVGVNDSISQSEIENLPINGRRWDNFVLLTPGVAGDGT